MDRRAIKWSSKIGENLKYAAGKWLEKHLLKVSTMVGGNFEICWLQMTRKALKIVHRGWRKF